MRSLFYISIVFVVASCGENQSINEVSESISEANDSCRLYINEQGEVRISQLNDTVWKTEFKTINDHVFDTVMTVGKLDTSIWNSSLDQEEFFLKYHWGGLSVSEDEIHVLEFSSYGMLASQTKMWVMYQKPFVRADKPVQLEGDLIGSKNNITLNGIAFNPNPIRDAGKYVKVTGKVVREENPTSFYSTDESPQGTLTDTAEVAHRLVFNDYDLSSPKLSVYKGYPVNNSQGQAALAWEFADSESYVLEGHDTWTTDELNSKISVSAYLVQNESGSYLKNWEIINGH